MTIHHRESTDGKATDRTVAVPNWLTVLGFRSRFRGVHQITTSAVSTNHIEEYRVKKRKPEPESSQMSITLTSVFL